MKLKVEGIIIDLDGTLVDSREAYHEALVEALKKLGVKEFNPSLVLEIPRRLEQNLPMNDLLPKINVKEFLKAYLEAYYRIAEEKAKLLPNAQKNLETLSRKARLALLTMRYVPCEKIGEWLEKVGLAKYFQCVVTALNTRFPKPSPKALIDCAERLGVKVGECVIVGDSVTDIKAGKNAGAKTVAVLSGIFTREELEREKPDLIIRDISELPNFLD
ncbi:HAD family hydrolase [Candidatus Bathyarchaeota archaeon]|nr:HAD family hydrolase [Candidatus Bathyarchaeota archaeon]